MSTATATAFYNGMEIAYFSDGYYILHYGAVSEIITIADHPEAISWYNGLRWSREELHMIWDGLSEVDVNGDDDLGTYHPLLGYENYDYSDYDSNYLG